MKTKLIACLLLIFASSSAYAGVVPSIAGSSDIPMTTLFNFQVTESQEGALPDMFESWVDNSYWITMSAAFAFDGIDPTPWLDGPAFGNKPAGLGVCKTNDCDGSDDDNMELGESVKLYVNQAVKVGDIYFRNGVHDTTWDEGASVGIAVDGNFEGFFALQAVLSDLADVTITSFIEFTNGSKGCGDNGEGGAGCELYVSGFGTPVPVPAAVWLFGSALVGLVGLRRNRQTS